MSDQTMRGMRLGAISLESARGAGLEPRATVEYLCPASHAFEVVFSSDAELPDVWECRVCGKNGIRQEAGKSVELQESEDEAGRTHWQMLLERRSISELEEILAERLEYLRDRRARAS